jgi:prepilin-type N-terminal cleavage/methylation domain-containing protein
MTEKPLFTKLFCPSRGAFLFLWIEGIISLLSLLRREIILMRRFSFLSNLSETFWNTFRLRTRHKGFTVVEVVIVLAIITMISSIILANFSGFNEGVTLSRSVRELALAARKAQNMALAVLRVTRQDGTTGIPRAMGIQVSRGTAGYFIFADFVNDNRYNQSDDEKISPGTMIFERGAAITDFLGKNNTLLSASKIHIIFASPEAAITLTDENGTDIGEKVTFRLVSQSGKVTKSVTVRTSGQISAK